MKCFICGTESSKGASVDDCLRLSCPKCGEYKISDTAIATMKKNGFQFNVKISRQWLQSHRRSGDIPLIVSEVAITLI
ncbi:hypothetical protein [Pseudomonas sp. DSP3-2-2]|uniref:hypothetical protein n=1 Tax=unclassified Pseudomonas TaxID=196821 RepID=UPI003CF2E1DA